MRFGMFRKRIESQRVVRTILLNGEKYAVMIFRNQDGPADGVGSGNGIKKTGITPVLSCAALPFILRYA